jgi:cytoskeletal protein CcmA (bactofilin family)
MWGEETKMKKEDKQIKAYMGEDTVFNGSLSFEGTVRVDGKFEGQVNTDDTLIVGETGHVTADIYAGTVICMGRVEGTIEATKKVEIHSNSRIVGNVKTPAMYIELGGILDGSCNMTGKESKIIPLVKTEEKEKEKKSSNQSKNG